MDDEIDPEIAAAMGFTGFGAINKRKFGSTTDAFVDGQGDETRRKNQKSGTGANDTALGSRKQTGQEKAQYAQSDQNKSKSEENGDKDGSGITGSKAKGKKKTNAPIGLADYIAWGNKVAEQPAQSSLMQSESTVTAQSTTRPQEGALPEGSGTSSWPQGMPSQQELAALRRGVQNARGDVAYFLPSFIENPWTGLG